MTIIILVLLAVSIPSLCKMAKVVSLEKKIKQQEKAEAEHARKMEAYWAQYQKDLVEQRKVAQRQAKMAAEQERQKKEQEAQRKEQERQRKEQERMAKEQARQAAQIAKQEEDIMKLENRLAFCEGEIAFNREQRERLFKLLDLEELELASSIENSATWQQHQRKIISLNSQIHAVQKRIDKAMADKRICESKLA